ncbi:MFS transporter [Trueperella pyogenes]|uniref:MFS transporter n=2 Tax=Trueperella TaxID=1069494 RepID=A0ABV3NDU6_9ACTO
MAYRESGQVFLLAEQALSEFGRQFTYILVPYVLVKIYSASAGDLAAISTVASVTAMIASAITAYIARRIRTVQLAVGGCLNTMECLICVWGATLQGWPLATVVLLYLLVTLVSSTYSVGIVVAVTEVAKSDNDYLILNGRRNLVQSTASILGPSLVGALVVMVEAPRLFLVDALASLASALVFLRILRGSNVDRHESEHAATEATGRCRPSLRGHYVAARTTLTRWASIQGVIAGLLAPALITFCRRLVMTILPVILIADFGATSIEYGIVYSAGGVGYLIAASFCSWRAKGNESLKRSMSAAIPFGVACLSGLMLMVLGDSTAHIVGACLFTAGSGAFGLVVDVLITTHRQKALDLRDLTSVTSLSDAIETAGMLSAAVASGIFAAIWGPRVVACIAAFAYLVMVVLVARKTILTKALERI